MPPYLFSKRLGLTVIISVLSRRVIKSERHCVLQKSFVLQGMNNQKRVPLLLCSSPSAITMLSLLQSLEGQLEL